MQWPGARTGGMQLSVIAPVGCPAAHLPLPAACAHAGYFEYRNTFSDEPTCIECDDGFQCRLMRRDGKEAGSKLWELTIGSGYWQVVFLGAESEMPHPSCRTTPVSSTFLTSSVCWCGRTPSGLTYKEQHPRCCLKNPFEPSGVKLAFALAEAAGPTQAPTGRDAVMVRMDTAVRFASRAPTAQARGSASHAQTGGYPPECSCQQCCAQLQL